MSLLSTLTLAVLIGYGFISWKLNRGEFVFSPAGIHLAYLTLYVVLPAVALYELGVPHMLAAPVFVTATVLRAIIVGTIGFAAGARLVGRARLAKAARIQNNLRGNKFRLFLFVSAVLSFIFLLENWGSIVSLNSIQALADPDHYAAVQEFKTDALYGATYLLQGAYQVVPFVALFYLAKHYSGERKLYWYAAIVLIAADTVFLLALGALWVAFATILMALLVRHYFRPIRPKQIIVVALILVLIVIGSLSLKHGLSSVDANGDGKSSLIFVLLGERFSSGAATLQVALDTFPRVSGFEYGTGYLRDVVGLIPSPIKRQLLPPDWWGGFNGFFFRLMFGFPGGTTQIPIIGEFYANFGMPGIFVCSVFYGAFLQYLSNLVRRRSMKRLTSVVLTIVLGYRLAEATVEGVGDRFMVSCLWAVIFIVVYSWYPAPKAKPAGRLTGDSPLYESRQGLA